MLLHYPYSILISIHIMHFHNSSLNSDISDWDVSEIDDMSGLFENQSHCNPDISDWDVSNVEEFVSFLMHTICIL